MSPKSNQSDIRCHKIRLVPTKEQEQFLLQACGNRRHAYNYGIAWFHENINKDSKDRTVFNSNLIRKEYTAKIDEQFPWIRKSSKEVFQEAFVDVTRSIDNFFKRCKNGKKKNLPKFATKNDSKQRFRINRK